LRVAAGQNNSTLAYASGSRLFAGRYVAMLPQSNVFVSQKQHARNSEHDSLGNQRVLFRTPPDSNCRPQIELTPQHAHFSDGENPSEKNKAWKIHISFRVSRHSLATLTDAPRALNPALKTGHCL
jgi:hypothetical protein